MNELSIAGKLLVTVAGAMLLLCTTHSIGHLSYKMAEAAVLAQQHDQMSHRKFSRQLWSSQHPAGKR